MRSDNQPRRGPGTGTGTGTGGTDYGGANYGDANYGGADFGGPLTGGPGSGGKRPWFGPKRIGWGYSPKTWQGWLVTGISIAAVITAGAVAKGSPWLYAVVVAAIAVHLVIIVVQRPRR